MEGRQRRCGLSAVDDLKVGNLSDDQPAVATFAENDRRGGCSETIVVGEKAGGFIT